MRDKVFEAKDLLRSRLKVFLKSLSKVMDPRVAFRHQVKYVSLCIILVIVFCVPEKRKRGQTCWLASAEAFCKVAYSWNHQIWNLGVIYLLSWLKNNIKYTIITIFMCTARKCWIHAHCCATDLSRYDFNVVKSLEGILTRTGNYEGRMSC